MVFFQFSAIMKENDQGMIYQTEDTVMPKLLQIIKLDIVQFILLETFGASSNQVYMKYAERENCQSEQPGLTGNAEFMANKRFMVGIRS